MLLSQLHGEGRVTFRALRAAGFYSVSAIAEAPVQSLADRAHLSGRTARRLKSGAEEMIGKGLGVEPAGPLSGRSGRAARGRGASGAVVFSPGVLLEEALLLGQGARGAVAVAEAIPMAMIPSEPIVTE